MSNGNPRPQDDGPDITPHALIAPSLTFGGLLVLALAIGIAIGLGLCRINVCAPCEADARAEAAAIDRR